MSYIDLHIHTKSLKNDEPITRNCDVGTFVNSLTNSNVKIAAITNHNHFDMEQYYDFSTACSKKEIIVFPGIELDVKQDDGVISHCLIICNPKMVDHFNNICKNMGLTEKAKANSFQINIKDLCSNFDNLEAIIIIHYGSKSKSFSEESYQFLKENLKNVILVEPSNLISAFIYLSSDIPSIVGSDCKDWSIYPGKKLPELKYEVDSFEHLMLLFKKDGSFINSILDIKKKSQNIHIKDEKFNDLELDLPIYNDINIIFGGKSTGKSIIIENLYKFYLESGFSGLIKYEGSERDKNYSEVKSFKPTLQDEQLVCDLCVEESIKELNSIKIPSIPNTFEKLRKFYESANSTLKEKVGFVTCIKKFDADLSKANETMKQLKQKLNRPKNFQIEDYKEYLNDEEAVKLDYILNIIIEKIKLQIRNVFVKVYSEYLSNKTIQSFKDSYEKMKGSISKTNSIGLSNFFDSLLNIKRSTSHILKSLNIDNVDRLIPLGELDSKGKVYRREQFGVCPDKLDSKFSFNDKKIKTLRNIYDLVKKLNLSCFSDEYKNDLNILIEQINSENIKSSKDFLGYKSSICNENKEDIDPSTGEQSILTLGNKLFANGEIYIFDEPEMSVGHDYVNRVVIPQLRKLSSEGKTVIISTHDANIAVRTLPYVCIYREQDKDGYKTYIGNPFIEQLKEVNSGEIKYWKERTMSILEGGETAFGERTIAYGK